MWEFLPIRLHKHPDGHGDHHDIFGEGDEAEGDVAVAADASAFELSFVDIDGLEDRQSFVIV